jgi:hypothetical protein
MNNLITCQNCWTRKDCRNCEFRPVKNVDLENVNADRAMNDCFKLFIGLTAAIIIIVNLI